MADDGDGSGGRNDVGAASPWDSPAKTSPPPVWCWWILVDDALAGATSSSWRILLRRRLTVRALMMLRVPLAVAVAAASTALLLLLRLVSTGVAGDMKTPPMPSVLKALAGNRCTGQFCGPWIGFLHLKYIISSAEENASAPPAPSGAFAFAHVCC